MAIRVTTSEELKQAINSGASEIEICGDKLMGQIKAVSYIKKRGPIAVGVVIAAIPLIVGTGGLATFGLAAAAPGAAWATSAIVALCIAIGGSIAISLFTDWDVVELPGILKLERRRKG